MEIFRIDCSAFGIKETFCGILGVSCSAPESTALMYTKATSLSENENS